jgi:hypothetical protein
LDSERCFDCWMEQCSLKCVNVAPEE